MDPIVSRDTAEYITNVFLTTENAVAVLTAGRAAPGRPGRRTCSMTSWLPCVAWSRGSPEAPGC